MIFSAFRRWQENANANQHRRGFDYAAGELLRDPSLATLDRLETEAETSRVFEGKESPFDAGIQDALGRWCSR